MISRRNILEFFKTVELKGHFVYASGKHGTAYLDKRRLCTGEKIQTICREMVCRFNASFLYETETVVGPENGGIIISQLTAQCIRQRTKRRIWSVYADETKGGRFLINKSYAKFVSGKKVLVVDDILTTGGSVKSVLEALDENGADILGVAVLCNRGRVTAETLNVPELFSLVDYDLDSWTEQECKKSGPCSKNIPVNQDFGHGRDFLIHKAQEDVVGAANKAMREVFKGGRK